LVEHIYLCHQCGNIFRLPADISQLSKNDIKCPQCGHPGIRELPSWVPVGSNLSEAPLEWEYECQQCQHKFKLPVPGSPSQEKSIECPSCHGGHIHRLTAAGYEPLYCG